MKIVGLTGGIASGKSTVSNILRQLGIPVIDSDAVVKELSQKGFPIWQAIYDNFGEAFYTEDGELNRRALGDYVFADNEAREKLNNITHPIVKMKVIELLNEIALEEKAEMAVIDVPLLYESGWDRIADQVWVVFVPRELQIERLMQRDGYTREQAELRINSQMNLEEKCRLADRVIDNSQSVHFTRMQVEKLIKM